jgi:hypothetical protein
MKYNMCYSPDHTGKNDGCIKWGYYGVCDKCNMGKIRQKKFRYFKNDECEFRLHDTGTITFRYMASGPYRKLAKHSVFWELCMQVVRGPK